MHKRGALKYTSEKLIVAVIGFLSIHLNVYFFLCYFHMQANVKARAVSILETVCIRPSLYMQSTKAAVPDHLVVPVVGPCQDLQCGATFLNSFPIYTTSGVQMPLENV